MDNHGVSQEGVCPAISLPCLNLHEMKQQKVNSYWISLWSQVYLTDKEYKSPRIYEKHVSLAYTLFKIETIVLINKLKLDTDFSSWVGMGALFQTSRKTMGRLNVNEIALPTSHKKS